MTTDQMLMERPTMATTAPRGSTLKTILLHIQDDKFLDQRIESGLSLARASSAHLNCLHVTPIEAYVAFDTLGGVFVMGDVMKALDEEEARIRSKVEDKLRKEDVSWDYTQVTGNVAGHIISYAALADLVVVGREPHRSGFAGSNNSLFGDLLQRSRTPLFIPAEDGAPTDVTGAALIGWNGSYEAANAVRLSVGLLKLAAEVRIIQIEEKKDETFPNTRLLEYLSRQGIHAELVLEPAREGLNDQQAISASLMATSLAANAAYVVMGGYSHNRIAEYIFGGVTHTMLSGSIVPLVIAR